MTASPVARPATTEVAAASESQRAASPAATTLAATATVTVAAPATASAAIPTTTAPSAAPAPEPRTTEALITALASNDGFVVADAANELAQRREPRAIPTLAAIDIRKSPHGAPSVIEALGNLASGADPAPRTTATNRLLELFAQERSRTAPESAGNVLVIYAALGRTRESRAATALEAELLDPKVTLAAKTVIVEALVRLKQPTSAAPLRVLQQQLAALAAPDALEEEVRRELAAAVEEALKSLP